MGKSYPNHTPYTGLTRAMQFVVNGEVYDATEYLDAHPGGADSILLVAGEDATEDFMAIHSTDAKKKLAEVRCFPSLYLCPCINATTVPYRDTGRDIVPCSV